MSHPKASPKGKLTAFLMVGAAFLTVGAAAIGGTLGIGTANAGSATASAPAEVDCDGIQHGEMSPSTNGAVDGQGEIDGQGMEDYTSKLAVDGSGSEVGGQAVEDTDGTQGGYCGADSGTVPRC